MTMRTNVMASDAVIIGANGFIGRRLTEALSTAHVEVEAYTRERRFANGTELVDPLRNAAVVFYLATSIHPALGELHPEWAAADHWQFAGLLRELAMLESPPTVVLTSSGGTVYDSSEPPPYTERSATRATSLYGAAKIAMEDELAEHAGAVPGVVLRLSNVYGPGQRTGKNQGVLAYWLRAAAQGTVLPVVGDPENTRDYVYIDDLAACMCLVYEAIRDRPDLTDGEPLILNVGSGTGTSLTELAQIVQQVVGRDLALELLSARRIDRAHVWLDCDRARRILGWRPKTRLIEGVSAMWREFADPAGRRLQAPVSQAWTAASAPDAMDLRSAFDPGLSPSSRSTPIPGPSLPQDSNRTR
jgi:UDP-glucose 4-epimerase